MKTRFTPRDRSLAGNTLLLTMCIAAAMMIMLAATMNRTIGTTTMNGRNNQFIAGLYAAEAATEKAYGMIRADFLANNLNGVTNGMYAGRYQGAVPLASENAYWNQYQFSDSQGHLNSNYVYCTMSSWQLTTNWGPLPSQYAGLYGWTNCYRVISNVKQIANTTYSMTNACQLDIGLDLIPIFQFAIFYNGLLEFTWCAPFTINGLTHANNSIYTGSIEPLTFNGLVTTTGTVSQPAWDGQQASAYSAAVNYNAGYSTNSQALTLPIGTTNVIAVLAQSTNSSSLYYNAANLVLLVSNSTVSLTLQNSSTDLYPSNIVANYYPTNVNASNYTQITTNFPFLNVTNTFTDQRESDTVKATDIDVGILGKWLTTNKIATAKFPSTAGVYTAGNVPDVLYVADNRTYSSGQLTAVRLKDGTTIPTNTVCIAGTNDPSGLTVATPNPLYVEGNYNCPSSSALNTTNTTATYPASLVSDALTVLSSAWVDANSNETLGNSGGGVRTAVSTTVNAAILTGIVPSTGSGSTQYSGGVMNLPRLLEDWGNGGSVTLTLNTSIVNLFNSARATNQWQSPGKYYYAPTRQFSFNQNYMNYSQQPPGTPMLGYVLRAHWCLPPPGTTNYAGN
jgi:hypothetical protein